VGQGMRCLHVVVPDGMCYELYELHCRIVWSFQNEPACAFCFIEIW
jgi:hypothetical protein